MNDGLAVEEDESMKTPMTPEYEAAIAKLSREPGACLREGCGAKLFTFAAPPMDFDLPDADFMKTLIPLKRFGCPHHDIFVVDLVCDDGGIAVLRDPADPVWGWAPPAWRPAVAATGFGFRAGAAAPYPRLRFGETAAGRVVVTEGKNMLVLPAGITLARVESTHGIMVESGPIPDPWSPHGMLTMEQASMLKTNRLREEVRVPPEVSERLLSMDGRAAAVAGRPSDLGYSESWDEHHLAIDETIVPRVYVEMVEAFAPEVTWWPRARMTHLVGMIDGEPIAVIGHVDVIEMERRKAASPPSQPVEPSAAEA